MDAPFQQSLGSAFRQLPEPVRRVHSLSQPLATTGVADIETASGLIPRAICSIAGLPKPGRGTPVSVTFALDGHGGERWDRRFGRRRYVSRIAASAAESGVVVEHFGPFALVFRLTPKAEGLAWSLARWKVFGVLLPRASTPQIECLEGSDGGRFTFDIDVSFPVIGKVIHYRGWLRLAPK
jgi:hypothetical protein